MMPAIPRLYRASINGGESLLDLLDQAVDVESVTGFFFSPDSQYVVYQILTFADFYLAVNSVPIDGGISNRLSGVPTSGGGASILSISSDSALVYFLFSDGFAPPNRLFSAPIDGGTEATEVLDIGIRSFGFVRLIKNEQEVLFTSEDSFSGLRTLFTKDLTNPDAPNVLLASVVSDTRISSISINPGETSAAFLGSRLDPVSGLYLHIVTSVDLIERTSTVVLVRQNENSSFFEGVLGGVLVDEVGNNIVLFDSQDIAGIKAVSKSGRDVRVLSDASINGTTIFAYGISSDFKKIIYVAGESSANNTDANLFIVDIEQAQQEAPCFPIKVGDKKVAIICL